MSAPAPTAPRPAPLMSESTEIAARELLRAIEADVAAGAPEIAITISPDGIKVRRAEDTT